MDRFNRTHQINGPLSVGFDDTGYDVKFFGATSGAYWLWDESADAVVLAGNARRDGFIWVGPEVWDVTNASAALGQFNSLFRAILMNPLEAASGDVDVYAWWPAPDDIDVSACMSACVMWSSDTALASQAAQVTVNASMFGAGEAEASTVYGGTATKLSATASEANTINMTAIATDISVPAVGDLMGLHVSYHSSGSSTTGSDFQFHGLKIGYTSATL